MWQSKAEVSKWAADLVRLDSIASMNFGIPYPELEQNMETVSLSTLLSSTVKLDKIYIARLELQISDNSQKQFWATNSQIWM